MLKPRSLLPALAIAALVGCQAAPSATWTATLMDEHALFGLGRLDSPVVEVANVQSSGDDAGYQSGGSGVQTAPTATSPPVSHGGGGSSGPPPPPPTPAPAEVLSNTLDPGPGAIAGVVLDVVHGGVAVSGVKITVVSSADPTKRAELRNGPDGRYRVDGVALGMYEVVAEKTGFVAGMDPVEAILFPGAEQVLTVNLALSPP